MSVKNKDLAREYEKTSYNFECMQMNPELGKCERDAIDNRIHYNYTTNFNVNDLKPILTDKSKRVIVLRDIGSNSDKEMKAAFF